MQIHKTAIIDPKTQLADDITVGPYTIIHKNVKIGPGAQVGAHCVINEYAAIGKNCQIFTGAVVGSITQDKKFKGEKSFLEIGDNNIIREYVTINRGTEAGSTTKIGNDNLFMAYSHIAHDCKIGNGVVLANCGTLAGYVTLEDGVIVGGLAAIHQFVRIGKITIIGGCSKVVQDIVPYSMSDGHPAIPYGINSIGLERAGYPDTVRDALKKAFKIIFSMKLNLKNAIKKIQAELPPQEEITYLINFINSSERGISR